MEDYHNTAYVITGLSENGRLWYYFYDFEENEWSWISSVFDANLYSTIDDAKTFKRHIMDYTIPPYGIKKVWIEKLTTTTIPEDTPEEV